MLDKDDVTDEDILQAERFMRNTPLDPPEKRNSNRCQMLHYFRITRPSRRRFIAEKKVASSVVLNKYPRLKDMQEAVSITHLHFFIQITFLYNSSNALFLF